MNTPQGMRPFNLQDWQNGAKPIFIDGFEPKDLHYFELSKRFACSDSSGEHIFSFPLDYPNIFLKSEKKEGWVNLYKSYKNIPRLGELVFESEQEANLCSGEDYLTTVKIEWYE